ncbi:MAG: hypothetical protein ACTSQJ_03125 [Promethearchaeota archaeon]
MSKALSFFEWELNFRSKSHSFSNFKKKEVKVNSLGILEEDFKKYLEKWKERNNL